MGDHAKNNGPSQANDDATLLPAVRQATGVGNLPVPPLIRRAGPRATERFIEYFTAGIANDNTRAAYARAVSQFFDWLDAHGLQLLHVKPVVVATYFKQHTGSIPTSKQHAAAVRMLFDYLVTGHVLEMNPASAVKTPRYSITKGKTPVLSADDTRQLLDSIETTTIAGLRDRAIIGCMVFSMARVGAVTGLDVGDYYPNGKRFWLRLHEKNGKHLELPVHHKLEELLDAYITSAGIAGLSGTPLFRTLDRRRNLTDQRITRRDVWAMVKRRARRSGISPRTSPHSFRATAITEFLRNGGTLEHAQRIAGHASSRTTSLYDRSGDEISLDEIERILI